MQTSSKPVVVALFLAVALSLPTSSASGGQIDSNWIGGVGNWNVAGNWGPAVVPDNGPDTYRVFIDHGDAAASIVTLNVTATIDALFVDIGESLIVGSGRALHIEGGIIANNGAIQLGDPANNYTTLSLDANATLSGTGEVILTSGTYSQLRGDNTAPPRLLNEAGHTIRGAGWLGSDIYGRLAVTNRGTVHADANGGTFTIDPYAVGDGAADFVNTGLLKASNGGTLKLTDGAFDNTGGLMRAEAGSVVAFASGVAVTGGTLTTTGDGQVRVTGSASIADLANEGSLVVASGNTLGMTGAVVNNGSIQIGDPAANYTALALDANAALSGAGEVILTSGTYSQLRGDNTALPRLTNEAGHTIRGTGWLGTDVYGRLAVTNRGTVHADSNGHTLTIDPYAIGDGAADFVNTGQLKASGGAALKLATGAFDNTGGLMRAEAGSVVEFASGAAVTGGTLTTTGDGQFRATGSASIADLANEGSFVVASGNTLGMTGAVVNSGSIKLGDVAANYTALALDANATLSGTGEVILTSGTYSQLRGDNTALPRLTNEAGHTIRGTGWLGSDIYGRLAVTNRGTVHADSNGRTLTIDPYAVGDGEDDFLNAGLLKASGGGTLAFADGTFTNTGVIEADSGSAVSMIAVGTVITNYDAGTQTLTGGQWKALAGAGAAVLNFGSRTVVNNAASVTLSGAGSTFAAIDSLADNKAGGEFLVAGGRTFTTAGALANAGLVSVGAGSTVNVAGAYTQTAGQTVVNGLLSATGTVLISGGEVGGEGTVSAPSVLFGGTFAPGSSAGTLTFERLHIQTGASYTFQLDGPLGDRVEITGDGAAFLIDLDGSYVIDFIVLDPVGALSEYTLFHWTGDDPLAAHEWGSLHDNYTLNLPPGCSADIFYDMDRNSILLGNVVVPEPATLCLLALGAGALLRRK